MAKRAVVTLVLTRLALTRSSRRYGRNPTDQGDIVTTPSGGLERKTGLPFELTLHLGRTNAGGVPRGTSNVAA
jgi:hypothetical protein